MYFYKNTGLNYIYRDIFIAYTYYLKLQDKLDTSRNFVSFLEFHFPNILPFLQ